MAVRLPAVKGKVHSAHCPPVAPTAGSLVTTCPRHVHSQRLEVQGGLSRVWGRTCFPLLAPFINSSTVGQLEYT